MRRRSFALGAAAALALPCARARSGDLVVAQVAPLSGVLASTGKQMVLGGRLCFEQVNAAGGIHGRHVEHVVADDGYKVDDTERLTRELLAKPEVLALFGFAGTANVTKLLADGVLQEGGAPLPAAFVKRYRELGGGAQLYNISVVDPAEIVKLAGLRNAHGLGICQVVPYPYTPTLPVVREYQDLLKRYAPGQEPNYTSFEEYLGAKVLVEGLRRAGPNPTRAKVLDALQSLTRYDLGGVTVGYGPDNRVGSRYVEVTVIGSSGKLLK